MSDDPLLQASAYLDGELSADERARAEAEPAVTAMIAQLRSIRDLVREVEPLDDTRRDRLVAAALDAAGPATAEGRRSSVVPMPSRPTAGRWLGVAAAVVAVAGLGVVAVASLDGGRDDDSTASDAAATVAAPAPDDADDGERLDAPAGATALTESEAMTEMPAETVPGGGADAPDSAATEASERTVPTLNDASPTPYRVLSSPGDLAAFARDAAGQIAAGSPPPEPLDCPDPSVTELVGRATYVSTPDGVAVDVVVGIARGDVRGAPTAVAIGTLTCDVVATSPLD
jgi:hypothetical protein